MTLHWTVVVPVKGTADSKSRLAPARTLPERAALAAAFATDAVTALLETPAVAEVIVVAPRGSLAVELEQRGVRLVADPGEGLNAAVRAGLAAAGLHGAGLAAMLGDLPALTSDAVATALAAAAAYPLAYVSDEEGTGTTLITATGAHPLIPRFGAGSAERHAAAGHHELGDAAGAPLRRDVDTEPDLDAALALGVGLATRAALALQR
ncbi:2-phospho-L-lactate guanylyltransferase [Cnuibacter sp. UC19_7]|uniref:2-phospho-L-lactate guanylyltransferase n=1 Tax=Cnuibacter sp. UC19_7 TaxID=3350166 RepID=UPI00366E0CFD